MGDVVSGYVAVIVMVIFLIFIPVKIRQEYYNITQESYEKQQVDEFVWMIEMDRTIHIELLEYDFQIQCLNADYEEIAFDISADAQIPGKTRYVHVLYGGIERWIVFE